MENTNRSGPPEDPAFASWLVGRLMQSLGRILGDLVQARPPAENNDRQPAPADDSEAVLGWLTGRLMTDLGDILVDLSTAPGAERQPTPGRRAPGACSQEHHEAEDKRKDGKR